MIPYPPLTSTPIVLPHPGQLPAPGQHPEVLGGGDDSFAAGDEFVPSAQGTEAPAGEVRLLVVDDDLSVIEFLGQLLRGFAQVSFATNGEDALRLAILQRPDLILLDIEMPGGSGFDVCQRLREEPALAAVPIIFATSHVDPHNEALALELGANDFLHKPFEPAQVMARLRTHLRNRPLPDMGPDADKGPARILLIDDDPGAIQLVRRLLREVGECHFSLNGHEAVGMAHELRPDLILLDIGMPQCDGFHLCKRLRADATLQHVPIMFLTQSTSVGEEARALALGGDDFVRKPFNAAVLLARVRRLVDRKRSVEQHLLQADQHRRKLSDARMASIVAACKDAIVIADAQDHIVMANASAGELFGITTEQMRSMALGDMLQRCDGVRRTVRHALGHEVPVEVSVSNDGSGADALTVLVLRDTLERDFRETQARHRDRLAARRASAALLAGVAHEFGGPLRALVGHLQLVMADKGNALTALESARLAHLTEAANQMKKALHDLTDLVRLASGQVPSEPAPLDLMTMVHRACDPTELLAAEGGLTVSLSGEPGLTVLADPENFQRCLEKFFASMVLAAHAGLKISVSAREGRAVVAVQSQGKALTAAQLQQFCDPFQRLARDAAPAPELPLGLVLARELAESCGASFQPGPAGTTGCCLELLIPLANESA